MNHNDTELSLLEAIRGAEGSSSTLTQREIARRSGLSLGMTNALLKRLASRGWVKLTRLSAKSFQYALTPDGFAEVLNRTAGYFRRASRDAELYREPIEAFVMASKQAGIGTLVLAGSSEFDFILEYLCERHDLVFVKSADADRALVLGRRPGVAILFSENCEDDHPGAATLKDILAGANMIPEDRGGGKS